MPNTRKPKTRKPNTRKRKKCCRRKAKPCSKKFRRKYHSKKIGKKYLRNLSGGYYDEWTRMKNITTLQSAYNDNPEKFDYDEWADNAGVDRNQPVYYDEWTRLMTAWSVLEEERQDARVEEAWKGRYPDWRKEPSHTLGNFTAKTSVSHGKNYDVPEESKTGWTSDGRRVHAKKKKKK